MMIIDFHTHIVWPELVQNRSHYLERDGWFRELYTNPKARLVTAEQLVAAMDAHGIDRAVTFGFAWADMALCRTANDYVAEAVRRYPKRLIGLAVVNLARREEALAELERCAALGLRGLGELMPDGQGYALDDESLAGPVFAFCQARRWPVLVHTNEPVGHAYPGKCDTSLLSIYRLAERYPDLPIVCAHWGGGLPFYELMPEVRQVMANVYYDTAASLYLYDASIFEVVAKVAPHKILFGTDYPLIGYGRFLRHVRQAEMTSVELEAALGGNAQRLLAALAPANGA